MRDTRSLICDPAAVVAREKPAAKTTAACQNFRPVNWTSSHRPTALTSSVISSALVTACLLSRGRSGEEMAAHARGAVRGADQYQPAVSSWLHAPHGVP